MIIWLDAQLPPKLAPWLNETFDVDCLHVASLDRLVAEDLDIFFAARAAKVNVIVTKDRDFLALVDRLGPPPQVMRLTCGNASVAALKFYLQNRFHHAVVALQTGTAFVEV